MFARSILFLCAVAAVLGAAPGKSRAQTREDWRATEGDAEEKKVVIQQSYTGVTPGSGNNLPRVEELKGKSGTWVTWPGFLMRVDGGSRLFLQTTVSLDYRLEEKKKRIVLKLNDAQVFLSNNRNPLVTTHFNTPIRRAYLKVRNQTTELVIELKVSKAPEITQMIDQDGYHYMFIDFPPGRYPQEKPASPRRSFSEYGTGPKPSGESKKPE
jgi:hypothetical protein